MTQSAYVRWMLCTYMWEEYYKYTYEYWRKLLTIQTLDESHVETKQLFVNSD